MAQVVVVIEALLDWFVAIQPPVSDAQIDATGLQLREEPLSQSP